MVIGSDMGRERDGRSREFRDLAQALKWMLALPLTEIGSAEGRPGLVGVGQGAVEHSVHGNVGFGDLWGTQVKVSGWISRLNRQKVWREKEKVRACGTLPFKSQE